MKPKSRIVSKSLSKNILQMKFMKRSVLHTEDTLLIKKDDLIDNEHWYISAPSYQTNK